MTDKELLRRAKDNLHGAKLCSVNSMSSRGEMLRLMDEAIKGIDEFLAAEPEAEPVYQIAMAEGSTSTAWIDVAKDVFDDAGMYPEYKRRALYTRPEPARKPMTHEEIIQGVTVDTSDDFHAGYWAGVRFAEKHHEIGDIK